MVRAATLARPEAVSQRQVVVDATADVAGFGGRIEAAYTLDLRPVPVGLVLAEATEHAPTAIRYALGE